jgi:hypothetical protein
MRGACTGTLVPRPEPVDHARMSDATLEDPTAAPARPDVRPRLAGTWAGVAVAVAFGLLADAATRVPPGLALTLGTWLAAGAIVLFARPRPRAWAFLAGAVVLGTFFSLRTSPLLLGLDLLGAAALLCVGASFGQGGAPGRTTTRSYLARAAFAPLEALPDGISSLAGPPARELSGRASPRAIARATVLILPVAAVLAILLGSADPVFKRYVHAPAVGPDVWPLHLLATLVGVVSLATLVAISLRRSTVVDAAAQRSLSGSWVRPVEWVGLLLVVDALFAIFVVIQFAVFFGGRTRVLQEQGLTYAEYARGGFWQLLGAAAIAGSVLAFAWHALPRPASSRVRSLFLVLAFTLVALVGVVLVSAFRRLMLYEDAYGLTQLRILVHATIVGLALLFVCVVVALARWRSSWLPSAAVAIVTVAVVALNVWNVDAQVAASNIDRAVRGHGVDASTLSQLSFDAVPAMVDAIGTLPAADRAAVEGILACRAGDLGDAPPTGWAGANRARSEAREALATLELPHCGR